MIFHGLFGMNFQPNGIKFAPLKPASVFAETISLEGVKYRGMVLNINVSGSGVEIASFEVDGQKEYVPFISGDLTGTHSVSITLGKTASDFVNEVPTLSSLDSTDKVSWTTFVALAGIVLIGLAIRGPMLRRLCRKKFNRDYKK
jgi:hypothetical protein